MRKIIKKITGVFAGLGAGYIASIITKYAVLSSGPYILMPIFGMSGPRPAANLEAIAEIVSFISLVMVWQKVYKLITREKAKDKISKAISEESS